MKKMLYKYILAYKAALRGELLVQNDAGHDLCRCELRYRLRRVRALYNAERN